MARQVVQDRVVEVDTDGIVVDVRSPEMTPDRGADVGTTVRTGDAPWMVLRVPSDGQFGDDEYIASTALAYRAEILAERHPNLFGHLLDLKVVYLWKKSGGKSKGRGVYGKAAKASGLVKHFSEQATFVIWLAADHCRGADFDERQIEALLFHELCHTEVADEDPETGRGGGPTLVPHDVEMFRSEVEHYGLWTPDLRIVAPSFRQAELFSDEGADDAD
jgi:Putative phage metallopeptidase